jgi:SAM-dependent methyltransferase
VTWHYGLVAEWWARFNTGGPEIDYFGRDIAAAQPALDAGCGAGRLLIPWLRAGYDVDGIDASADMLARCAELARAEGLEARLSAQALHELAPIRRYRTIVACGVFGLGSTMAEDREALRRMHDALEPGGTLLLDHEPPYVDQLRWGRWSPGERAGAFPEEWPAEPIRRRSADGEEYELRARALALEPLDQSVVLELLVEKRRAGEVVVTEHHHLTNRGYLKAHLVLLLELAGFDEVSVTGDYTDEPATAEHRTLVYRARRH